MKTVYLFFLFLITLCNPAFAEEKPMANATKDLQGIITVLSQEQLDPEQLRPVARLASVEKVRENKPGILVVSFKVVPSLNTDAVIKMMGPNQPEVTNISPPPLGANYAGLPVTFTYSYKIGTVQLIFGFDQTNNDQLVEIVRTVH